MSRPGPVSKARPEKLQAPSAILESEGAQRTSEAIPSADVTPSATAPAADPASPAPVSELPALPAGASLSPTPLTNDEVLRQLLVQMQFLTSHLLSLTPPAPRAEASSHAGTRSPGTSSPDSSLELHQVGPSVSGRTRFARIAPDPVLQSRPQPDS